MKTFKILSNRIPLLLFLTLFSTLIFTSCADNPAGGHDEEEHADPDGLVLVYDGEVIYEYAGGELNEHTHRHYLVGQEYLFEVHFLDRDGEYIHDDDLDEAYHLDWTIENEDILSIRQHQDDERWNFRLEGIVEGESKVQFRLMHGDEHADFETFPVSAENAIEFHIDTDEEGEYEHESPADL